MKGFPKTFTDELFLDILRIVKKTGEISILAPSNIRSLEFISKKAEDEGLIAVQVPKGCVSVLPPIPVYDMEFPPICIEYCTEENIENKASLRSRLYERPYPKVSQSCSDLRPLYHPAGYLIRILEIIDNLQCASDEELQEAYCMIPFLHIPEIRKIMREIRNINKKFSNVSSAPNTNSHLGLSQDGGAFLEPKPDLLQLFDENTMIAAEDIDEPFPLSGKECVDHVYGDIPEYLQEKDFEIITEDACFFDGGGENRRLKAVYLTGVMDKDLCKRASIALEPAATTNNLRAATNGGTPPHTGIVGFYDYINNPSSRKCRETEYTRKNWGNIVDGCYDFLIALDKIYSKHAPTHHDLQRLAIPTQNQLFGTAFSTITVNRNFRTAAHADKGDFRFGLGAVLVIDGEFEGCHLAIKALKKAFRLKLGDVLLFDTALEHGNTEILNPEGEWKRVSVVCYLRSGLMSPICEMERRRTLNRLVSEAYIREKCRDQIININSCDDALPKLYVPVKLTKLLANFQLAALSFCYEKLHKGNGCVIAMTMGLGKTLVALALSFSYILEKNVDVLILTPKSVLNHWSREYNKWQSCGLFFSNYVASEKLDTFSFEEQLLHYDQQLTGISDREPHLFVLNPEYFPFFVKRFPQFHPGLIIVDEGHRIATKGSKLTEVLDKLNCNQKVILSGTPVQNTAEELYRLIGWIDPRIHDVFTPRHFNDLALCISSFINGDDSMFEAAVSAQRSLIEWMGGFVFREMEAELPSLHDYLLICGTSSSQNQLAHFHLPFLEKKSSLKASEHRPHHLATHPMCFLFFISGGYASMLGHKAKSEIEPTVKMYHTFSSSESKLIETCINGVECGDVDGFIRMSGKLTALVEIVKTALNAKEKVVIFSQYVGSQDMIYRALTAAKIPTLTVRSCDSYNHRNFSILQFITNSLITALVLSTRIAAFGLDFTIANHVVLFDSWWNPQLDAQAIARAYRRNQKKPVVVYRLSSRFEDRTVFRSQIRKLALFQCIMHGRASRIAQEGEISDCSATEPDELRKALWLELKQNLLEGSFPAVLNVFSYRDTVKEALNSI